jgi:hypothetical protein
VQWLHWLLSGWLLERKLEGLMQLQQLLLLASWLEYKILCDQQEEVLEFLELLL